MKFGLIGLFLLVLTATGRAEPNTQDLLNEIDSATAPSAAPVREAEQPIGWLRLLELFAPSLATAASIAVAGGVAGTFVVLRREALIGLALPQVVAAGAAVGMRLAWPTLPTALVAAALALVYLVASRRGGGAGAQSVLPSLYIAGLSISFLVIANHGRDVEELQNLFTGVDVAVSPLTAWLTVPSLLLAAGLVAVLWRRWLLMAQAPSAAELSGLRPAVWDAFFLSLLAVILLLGTNAQGVVLVLAMLFLPVATVLPWASRVPAALTASALLGVGLVAAGFYLSNTQQWPLSQSIGGAGFATMLASHSVAAVRNRSR